ncbi:MAG: acyl-CoA thioesterase [Spirochaetaceae bacterium]|nr:acyl-CoA thioesterase [Spirochaetaceae bacterium]
MPAKERPDFVHPVTVRLHHTDAAGVIFCSRLLELAHEAYEALLDKAGLGVGRLLADGEVLLPVVAVEAEFTRPIRVGDRLQVELHLSRRGDHSYQVEYCFRDPSGRVKARAATRHVAIAAAGSGPVQLPSPLARLADGAADPKHDSHPGGPIDIRSRSG